MRSRNKTEGQLINELNKPGHRIIEESQLEGTRKQTEEALREKRKHFQYENRFLEEVLRTILNLRILCLKYSWAIFPK
jgi:hypothetical protein